MLEKPPVNDSLNSKLINYREYLQAELIETLQKGKRYSITIHYAIANYSTYVFNRLGVCLTSKKISNMLTSKVLKFKPILSVPNDTFYIERDYWYTLTDTLIANDDEKYITIGKFYNDNKTNFITLDSSTFNTSLRNSIVQNKIAYYYTDMVSVLMIKEK